MEIAAIGSETIKSLFPRDSTLLFIGDSITDAFRRPDEQNDAYQMGNGYVFLLAAPLRAQNTAANWHFLNRGIAGNGIRDVANRWEVDCLALQPDVVSLLIGVNDSGIPTPATEFERLYRKLLKRTRQHLPSVRFVLCEPFLLRCGEGNAERVAALAPFRVAVRHLAEEFGAVFVPFQSVMDLATQNAPAEFWAYDGIHPTAAGHFLLAHTWLEAVGADTG